MALHHQCDNGRRSGLHPLGWWVLGWCLLLGLALPAAPPVVAQSAGSLVVEPLAGGQYVAGNWLPLRVMLPATSGSGVAQLRATAPGSPDSYVRDVVLPTSDPVWLYVATDPAQPPRDIVVVLEQNGTVLAQQNVVLQPLGNQQLVGTVAQSLPATGAFQTVSPLAEVPPRVGSLNSFSSIVWGATAAPSDNLARNVLLAWVARGGHLLLVSTPAGSALLDSLPLAAQPATIGDSTVLDTTALATYGDPTTLPALNGVQLERLPGGIITGDPAAPLWVERSYGEGKITLLAFDPTDVPAWDGSAALFEQLLHPPLHIRVLHASGSSIDAARSNLLTVALSNLPPVNLPPLGVLLLVLLGYLLLVGPVVAWVLLRLDQQVLTWVLLPVLAGGAGVVLAGGAWVLRADQRMVTHLTLVEPLDASAARAQTFWGVLSPDDTTVTVSTDPTALVRPLLPEFGVYGAVAGVNGAFVQQATTHQFAIRGGAVQGAVVDQIVPFVAPTAQMNVDTNGWQVVVSNTTAAPLEDVAVLYASQLVELGTIAPGATAQGGYLYQAELANSPTSPGALVFAGDLVASQQPGQQPDRLLQARQFMVDATTLRGQGQDANPGPMVLAWLPAAPAGVRVTPEGAAVQQATLLMLRPTLTASDTIALGPVWVRPDPARDNLTTCFGSYGQGLRPTAPMTSTLTIPPDFAPLSTDALTLTVETERAFPNAGVQTRLYDWQAEEWRDISYDGPGSLAVPDPDRFVEQGTVRLALDGRIAETECVFPALELRGTLP